MNCLCLFLALHIILIVALLAKAVNNETDQSALLSFKYQISSDPSAALVSWNNSLHHCQWQGIMCSRHHPDRVTALVLDSLQLSGQISPSLGKLTFLQRLSLSDNQLFGRIPQEFGYLNRLRFINLSMNSLEGNVPSTLGNCSNLESLSLTNNNLKGTIPSTLVQCRNLKVINLRNNFLEGRIPPEFGFLYQLTALSLAYNNLIGLIPPILGNLSNLFALDLRFNSLNGPIPASLGQLQYLKRLILDHNNLSGKIPHSLYNISALVQLSLSSNQLQGSLPSDMCDVLFNLQVLLMYENQIKGQIPASISNCSALIHLQLDSNNFTGKVPSSIGNLGNLYRLNVANNQLEAKTSRDWGFIDALTNCTNLYALWLGNNQLQGQLPSSIGNLSSSLNYLGLFMSSISGGIPNSIGKLTNLIALNLAQAHLEGIIPTEIGYLSKLQALDMSDNFLSGEIPSNFGNLTRMSRIYLYNNTLQGSIPIELRNMQFLELLNISYNKLTGEIHKELLNVPSLSGSLDLSHNYLNGSLPLEIGNLRNIHTIVLSNNRLSGEIPSTIGGCQVLQTLYLDKNFFHGHIPSTLSNILGLQKLDLANNTLSGQIPESIGKINLQYLNISFNNFEGQLPKEGVFKNSNRVDLRGNPELCGGVPEMHLPVCISSNQTQSNYSRRIMTILCATAGALICLTIVMWFFVRYYWKRESKHKEQPIMAMKYEFKNVSYSDLFRATEGFSLKNLIGVGAFGSVYKAIMSFEDAPTVAVKVLNLEQHGASRSFISECEALRNIRHRNLMKILSVCSSTDHQGNEFKALLFEFMPNGSLEAWLHPNTCTNRPFRSLSLIQRMNIAIDVAAALDYLHNDGPAPIVHCDLKPSNVLLDADMTARVGDFGLAKFLVRADTLLSMTSTCGIKGSIGYIPPEYGMGVQASAQGDVYSYGILVLEIFTGVSPTDEKFRGGFSLCKHVEMAFPDNVIDIIDTNLLLLSDGKDNKYAPENVYDCLISVIQCGLQCTKELPKERIAIREVSKELSSARAKLLG